MICIQDRIGRGRNVLFLFILCIRFLQTHQYKEAALWEEMKTQYENVTP